MFQNPLLQHLELYKEGIRLNQKYMLDDCGDIPSSQHRDIIDGRYGRCREEGVDKRGCGMFLSCWTLQRMMPQSHQRNTPFTPSPTAHGFDDPRLPSLLDLKPDLHHHESHHNNTTNNDSTYNEIHQKCYQHNDLSNYPSLKRHKDSLAHLTDRLNRRRSRTNFTEHQLDILEATFQQHHYPDLAACERLSRELLLASPTIQIWFQNRRAKWRRQENTRRGPGRPSNNAPRRSCSGEPIKDQKDKRTGVKNTKSIAKKKDLTKARGRESIGCLSVESKEFGDLQLEINVESFQEDEKEEYLRHSYYDLNQDTTKHSERKYMAGNTHSSRSDFKSKYHNNGFLPFNIDNLLAN